jgi:hypothetical protein
VTSATWSAYREYGYGLRMTPRYDVSGKVVLLTGAARGIGAQTARVLAARGARLALVGIGAALVSQPCD